MRVRRIVTQGGGCWRRFGAGILLGLLALSGQRAVAQTAVKPLSMPAALAYDATGNLFIADANRHQVLEATLAGALLVVAGTGMQGFSGDGGPAAQAELNSPQGLAFGTDGTLYIADTGNSRIRAIGSGSISTFAGTGASGATADGESATAAAFRTPTALAVDAAGGLLVCDIGDHRIVRIAGGVVATFAGNGVQGFAGDGAPARNAELDSPAGIAVSADGRVFIADTHNNRVRVVAADGSISTFAGTGRRGFAGDGGPAPAAQLSGPRGLAITPGGSLVIADGQNQRIRVVSPAGVITSVAGSGSEVQDQDGVSATEAALEGPRVVGVSPFGFPVLGDALGRAVWVLTPAGELFAPAALATGRNSTVQPVWLGPQVYGQVTVTTGVSGAVGGSRGSLTLNEGGVVLGTGALKDGMATVSLPDLSAGTHSITVVYQGDGLNPGASAIPGALIVTPAPVVATATAASVPFGAPLPAFSGTLTGVLPQDAGQVSVVFNASAPTLASVGAYPISASLAGPKSGNYVLSLGAGSGSLQILRAASRTSLGMLAQSYAGLPLRLTAGVNSTTTSGQPGGTVQFLDGGTVVATAAIVNGSASGVYISPPAGPRSLTAKYLGDSDFSPSTSAAELAMVGAMPDFGLTAVGSGTAIVPAGSAASYTLQVQAQPSPFTGVVVLSAAGLPPGAVASFSPVQVVPGAGSATVVVNIQTPAQVALGDRTRASRPAIWAGLTLFLVALSSKRRRRLLLACGVSLWMCGCGARTVSEGTGGVVAQSYSVQISATSTNLLGSVLSHSTTVTLVVQN